MAIPIIGKAEVDEQAKELFEILDDRINNPKWARNLSASIVDEMFKLGVKMVEISKVWSAARARQAVGGKRGADRKKAKAA